MNSTITALNRLLLAIALPFSSIALSLSMPPVQAQVQIMRPNLEKPTAIAASSKQMGGRVPGRWRGGARRGNCPETAIPLTALVPFETNTDPNPAGSVPPLPIVGGLTIAERPTFWFYVPYELNSRLTAEFILQDAGQEIYSSAVAALPEGETTPGIIRVTLPPSIAPLKIGKTYQWYFKINCTTETPLFVHGGIQRIALDDKLANQLASASPPQQVELYRSHDLWYDAITILGNRYLSQPNDTEVAAEWAALLESISITDIPAARSLP